MVPFSELELEILDKLPDVPTQSSAASYFRDKAAEAASGAAMTSASYKEWIPFAARHTVLLLTKAPACPPLTRPQQSKVKQELYFDLLPILRAANMTMNDLDLAFTGPGKDGRMLHSRTKMSGTSVKIRAAAESSQSGKLSGGAGGADKSVSSFGKDAALMGGNALPFGVGLPKAVPESTLSWKVQEVPRNYYKAWSSAPPKAVKDAEDEEEHSFNDDIESKASKFFLTESEAARPPPQTSILRTMSNLSISHYDVGVPAPLPRNRSLSTLVSPSKMVEVTDSTADAMLLAIGGGSPVRSPYRAISPAQSSFLGSDIGQPRSLSVSVPATAADSPDPSLFGSEQTPFDARALNVEAEASVFTNASSAESEPFGMLSLAQEQMHDSTLDLPAVHQPERVESPPAPQKVRIKTETGRPEYVSGAAARPVLGFSADANWSNKFLLAPPSAVAQSNFTVGQSDPVNVWNFIEYAPVFVTSPTKRISKDTLKALVAQAQGQAQGVRAADEEQADRVVYNDSRLDTGRPKSKGPLPFASARTNPEAHQPTASEGQCTAVFLQCMASLTRPFLPLLLHRSNDGAAERDGHGAQRAPSPGAKQAPRRPRQGKVT
jgi:hypothetical protein